MPPFAAFYFDCYSTLSAIEGVDELTRSQPADVQRHVERLTRRAMQGDLPLAEVYPERMRLLRPGRAELEDLGQRYVQTLVPGARQVLQELREWDLPFAAGEPS